MNPQLERELSNVADLLTSSLFSDHELYFHEITKKLEHKVIKRLLIQCKGNRSQVAVRMGISRTKLLYELKYMDGSEFIK